MLVIPRLDPGIHFEIDRVIWIPRSSRGMTAKEVIHEVQSVLRVPSLWLSYLSSCGLTKSDRPQDP